MSLTDVWKDIFKKKDEVALTVEEPQSNIQQYLDRITASIQVIANSAYLEKINNGVDPLILADEFGCDFATFRYYVNNITTLPIERVFEMLFVLEAPLTLRYKLPTGLEIQISTEGES